MNYNDFTELLKSKNILLKDVLSTIQMSRQGLKFALDNETIELRKLKLLCETVRISPSQFFENGTFGLLQNNPVTQTKEVDNLRKEIEHYKQRIADKDEIILLLREKNKGYGFAADPQNCYELNKKK